MITILSQHQLGPSMLAQELVDHSWLIVTRRAQDLLGDVTWYSRGEQWVFQPEPSCIFTTQRLHHLMDFLTLLNEKGAP